jgi:hypothetical protein
MRPLAEAGVVFSKDYDKQTFRANLKPNSDRRLIVTQVCGEDHLVKLITSINRNDGLDYLIFFGTHDDSEFTVHDCLNWSNL